MPVYALQIAYDGTDFAGFQRQSKSVLRREDDGCRGSQWPPRTVQGVLEQALMKLTGETEKDLKIRAAGRTDAGVHATGQVIAFQTRRDWNARKWIGAMNALLPQDVSVQAAQEVPAGFQPRYHATGRSYRYGVLVRETPDPLRRRTMYRVAALPGLNEATEAWRSLVGTHDFTAFRSTGSTPRSPIVTVTRADVTRGSIEDVYFHISAVSFLYHMVRRLVGAVVAIGQGKLALNDFRRQIADPGAGLRPAPTAPAHGLCLTDVSYPSPWGWD